MRNMGRDTASIIKLVIFLLYAASPSLAAMSLSTQPLPEIDEHYNKTNAIFRKLFNHSYYNPDVIPVVNQSEAIYVEVTFSLISIEGIDDAKESFSCNGFLSFFWNDEILHWDPELYGRRKVIHPRRQQIWHPRVLLLNTLGDRDVFGEDEGPIILMHNGTVNWNPGSVFTTSCALSLLKYPFDEQKCSIKMVTWGLIEEELLFLEDGTVTDYYSVNGEWDLLEASLTTDTLIIDGNYASVFEVHFRLKRRSTFYVFNTIIPFVFLSLLNMLIFTIPQESGEKIGYGLTMLLAVSFSLSLIGDKLPKASNVVPYIIVYYFTLYVLSVCSVGVNTLIMLLYHMKERDEHSKKVINKLRRVLNVITRVRKAISSISPSPKGETAIFKRRKTNKSDKVQIAKSREDNIEDTLECIDLDSIKEKEQEEPKTPQGDNAVDRCKALAASLDLAALIIFMLSWIGVNVWFFVSVLE